MLLDQLKVIFRLHPISWFLCWMNEKICLYVIIPSLHVAGVLLALTIATKKLGHMGQ